MVDSAAEVGYLQASLTRVAGNCVHKFEHPIFVCRAPNPPRAHGDGGATAERLSGQPQVRRPPVISAVPSFPVHAGRTPRQPNAEERPAADRTQTVAHIIHRILDTAERRPVKREQKGRQGRGSVAWLHAPRSTLSQRTSAWLHVAPRAIDACLGRHSPRTVLAARSLPYHGPTRGSQRAWLLAGTRRGRI